MRHNEVAVFEGLAWGISVTVGCVTFVLTSAEGTNQTTSRSHEDAFADHTLGSSMTGTTSVESARTSEAKESESIILRI